jgi:predicted aminopeptidase
MTLWFKWKKWLPRRLVLAALTGGMLASCSTVGYYYQAAHGQLSLVAGSRPVEDWMNDAATDPKLRARLAKAREIRGFAVAELALPNNKVFRNYTALSRPFVMWNVVATPELSLKPIQWCFPIAGCVTYRGYYSKDDAQAYANELRAEGKDVQVGGVPAYSTLGWFNDPLLSTFINYQDAELARLVFHELAHQVAYAPGDTQFNESFATAVEEAGVRRWMDVFGNETMRENYAKYQKRKTEFLALLMATRKDLDQVYKSSRPDAEKRSEKARIFQKLKDDYIVLKASWGGFAGYDRFFAEPLSNAHLTAVGAYNDFVPAFRTILERSGSMPAFYAEVQRLAKLERAERHALLRRSM